jgi:hypothetical protein
VFATLAVTTATLAGCGGAPASEAATVEAASLEIMSQQADFWAALQALCGQAFAGTLAEGAPTDTAFAGKAMVMHVRECAPEEIKIPFHVGEDHSRTWVLTQTETGLRLKHDHRLSDGSEDEVTQYGGDTRDTGSATKQEFYADAFTAELIPAASTNVWTVEVVPGERFSYALRREGTDRRFRVDFDLTEPVEAPPAPWGHEKLEG